MPWHYKTMKDVITCEKLGGAGYEQWTRDIRMGKPGTGNAVSSYDEQNSHREGNLGNWNI